MNIPQEVRDRVERVMQLKMNNKDCTTAVIKAAQLPIQPIGIDEVDAVWMIGSDYSNQRYMVLDIANRIIYRRNNPKPVDPLIVGLMKVLRVRNVSSNEQILNALATELAAVRGMEGK